MDDSPSDQVSHGGASRKENPRLTPQALKILEEMRDQPPRPPHDPDGREPRTEQELMDRLPPALQRAMKQLRKEGGHITERLAGDAKLAQQFHTDPIGALKAMGIDVPPELARLGRPPVGLDQALEQLNVRLPGMQTVAPRVRIRFTDGGGA